jgi:hypothetical protein
LFSLFASGLHPGPQTTVHQAAPPEVPERAQTRVQAGAQAGVQAGAQAGVYASLRLRGLRTTVVRRTSLN